MSAIASGVSLETRLQWQGFTKDRNGPFFLELMTSDQKRHLLDWFKETSEMKLVGETTAPAIGLLLGLILGSNLQRIAQCGHYAGYSLLVLGMILQRLAPNAKIASVDIDQVVTRFTDGWLRKCEIASNIKTGVIDSSDGYAAAMAEKFLGGAPELVFIDSSHQYRHTIDELNLWASQIAPGGFICMHDAAEFCRDQDNHGLGGVNQALKEWMHTNPEMSCVLIETNTGSAPIYKDPCGFALLQILRPLSTNKQIGFPAKKLMKDSRFSHADQWICGNLWELGEGAAIKKQGSSAAICCYSPVVEGEKYKVSVTLADVKGGGLSPVAGGSNITAYFDSNGEHSAEIIASGKNSLLGLLSSINFSGRVTRFDAVHLS